MFAEGYADATGVCGIIEHATVPSLGGAGVHRPLSTSPLRRCAVRGLSPAGAARSGAFSAATKLSAIVRLRDNHFPRADNLRSSLWAELGLGESGTGLTSYPVRNGICTFPQEVLGVRDANTLARFAPRVADACEVPGFCDRCRPDIGTGNWRKHRHLQRSQCGAVAAPGLQRLPFTAPHLGQV